MTLADYIALFPGASRDKARFIAMAQVILTQVTDLQTVIADVAAAFTVDGASGEQLDIVAASLGLERIQTTDGVAVSDADFRDYIKKKLIVWGWDGTNKHALELAEKIIPGCGFVDNSNGTVTLTDTGTQPAPLESILPITAGVRAV